MAKTIVKFVLSSFIINGSKFLYLWISSKIVHTHLSKSGKMQRPYISLCITFVRFSRCRGYIEFYLNTKNLRRTPFYMVSIGNAVLLLTVTALHDYCDHENNCPDKFTKVCNAFVTFETLSNYHYYKKTSFCD